MTKNIIFEDSFFISGIMCFDGCGNRIQQTLKTYINACIKEHWLPEGTSLLLNAEPHALGIHHLTIAFETEDLNFKPIDNFQNILGEEIRGKLSDLKFTILNENQIDLKVANSPKKNWINLAVNLAVSSMITLITILLPPTLFITILFSFLSIASMLYTARHYFRDFYYHLKQKNMSNMSTTIVLGCVLSIIHLLTHVISMPFMAHFSMIFMTFIMPMLLMGILNTMDAIKKIMIEVGKKYKLDSLKKIFPELMEKYVYYPLSQKDLNTLASILVKSPATTTSSCSFNTEPPKKNKDKSNLIEEILSKNNKRIKMDRQHLKEGMLIAVPQNTCFPVDCILVSNSAVVDASLLTGEPQQRKKLRDRIPGGAINLGESVLVYPEKNAYNSAINTLLFKSNRANNVEEIHFPKQSSYFKYVYLGLIAVCLLISIVVPAALGVFTFSLMVQNILGILFSVCPCTIAIAHELPKLFTEYQRNKRDIFINNQSITLNPDNIKTFIFDKTGTLTTGNSIVAESSIPSRKAIWQKIHLLEKSFGSTHPIGKAIIKYCKSIKQDKAYFNSISEQIIDKNNRGLSAIVQGKKLSLGNETYFNEQGISIPQTLILNDTLTYTPVYVAENGVYQGVIYIKHEPRKKILKTLCTLKEQGKTLIMLTGDSANSAKAFNQQIGGIFEESNIFSEKTPVDKEKMLRQLIESKIPEGQASPDETFFFVGDGLNDGPACRIISQYKGISCSMTSRDKSAFFSDIALNGSLDYLFQHKKLKRSVQKNISQNRWALVISLIFFLALTLSFSTIGIALPAIIPLIIMTSTTLFAIFNAYRMRLRVDKAIVKSIIPLPTKIVASNLSILLLMVSASLLIVSLILGTVASGGILLPIAIFSAGPMLLIGSLAALVGLTVLIGFAGIIASHFIYSASDTQEVEKIRQNSSEKFMQSHVEEQNISLARRLSREPLALNPGVLIKEVPSKAVVKNSHNHCSTLFKPKEGSVEADRCHELRSGEVKQDREEQKNGNGLNNSLSFI